MDHCELVIPDFMSLSSKLSSKYRDYILKSKQTLHFDGKKNWHSGFHNNILIFAGQAFTLMLVYVWARRNPFVRMNFFGLLTFQAPYLPYVLLGFSLLLGNSVSVDLLGMAVGHTYYYLEDIFPNQPGGWQIIKTPQILKVLCDEAPEDPNYAPPPEERPGGYDWGQGEGADDQGDNNNVLHNDENQNLQEMPPAPNNNDNVL